MATFTGSAANDTYAGTAAADTIYGYDPNSPNGGGSDTLSGAAGNDTIFAVVGPTDHGVVDHLDGGADDDVLNFLINRGTGLSSASLAGGAGNDTINVTVNDTYNTTLTGSIAIDGGAGVDTVTLNLAQIVADTPQLSFAGVEALIVTATGIQLTAAQIAGVSGDIQFLPTTAYSNLAGVTVVGTGDVDLSASPGALGVGIGPGVSLLATPQDDAIGVGAGDPYAYGGSTAPDTVHGGAGNDTISLVGATSGSLIYGDAGDDVISAVTSSNSPYSSTPPTLTPQTIDGGAGSDTLNLGSAFSDGNIVLDTAATAQGLTLPDGAMIRNVETVNLTLYGENNVVHMGSHGGSVSLSTPGAATTIYSGPGNDKMSADIVYETPGGFDQVTTPAQTALGAYGIASSPNSPILHIDYSTAAAPVHMASETTVVAFIEMRGVYGIGVDVYDEAWVGGSNTSDVGATASVKFFESTDVIGSQYADVLAADNHVSIPGAYNTPSVYGTTTDFSESLYGGAGNDTLIAGAHGAVLDGGADEDTVVFNFAHTLASYQHVGSTLVVTGPHGADTLVGIEHLQFADGVYEAGADGPPVTYDAGRTISGTSGSDVLTGGSGPDTIYGGGGGYAGGDLDTITGGIGDDSITGSIIQNQAAGYYLPSGISVYAGLSLHYDINAAPALLSYPYFSPQQIAQTIFVSGGDEGGLDTLQDISQLRFLDGTLTFDAAGTPAEIYRLYDTFLNRAPDVAGLDAYQQYLASGHTLHDAAVNASASSEFQTAASTLSNADFVAYIYENTLDRAPDAYGLQQYTALLDAGESRVDFAYSVIDSAEHIQLTNPAVYAGLWTPDVPASGLALLYDTLFQREPDPYGLKAYEAEIASGTTFRQIANQAVSSAEYQAKYGGTTDKQFIDQLYENTVHRAPDAYGENAYLQELQHGYTRGDVIWQVSISAEHESYVLSHPDPSLFVF